MKLWGGRFEAQTDELMEQFNASIGFDWRMYDADIGGSVAYAKGLARAGLITPSEAETLIDGLEKVRQEFAAGEFEIRLSDEDIHTAVERRLYELVGSVAGKLHTGRSRNDQVATDMRLYTRAALGRVLAALTNVQAALLSQADAHRDVLMPGYTHVQRAQPVLFSHWLMSSFWALQRDRERLTEALARVNVLPLGSGALAGNALGVDRAFLAEELGFATVSPNSMDAVGDRDFVAETLFAAAMVGLHLSRLGEDLVMYSSAEFGFVTLDEAYATGSSLMPQKLNPDSMELVRGKAGRLVGNLVSVLTLLKGLPSTYDKDLQEDKEPLFDSLDTLHLTLPVVAGVIRTLRIHPERMAAALDDGMLATDLADYLVRQGVPFRESHGVVGRLVRAAQAQGVPLRDLPLDAYHEADQRFGPDVYTVFDMRQSVARRDSIGGTAPSAVALQLQQARALLNQG
ncbi:MAG: argininosuccinate lyase [Anaerolineae bacterium]|nr:argininosuccinate lyase [Anaerolineae bacterium]